MASKTALPVDKIIPFFDFESEENSHFLPNYKQVISDCGGFKNIAVAYLLIEIFNLSKSNFEQKNLSARFRAKGSAGLQSGIIERWAMMASINSLCRIMSFLQMPRATMADQIRKAKALGLIETIESTTTKRTAYLLTEKGLGIITKREKLDRDNSDAEATPKKKDSSAKKQRPKTVETVEIIESEVITEIFEPTKIIHILNTEGVVENPKDSDQNNKPKENFREAFQPTESAFFSNQDNSKNNTQEVAKTASLIDIDTVQMKTGLQGEALAELWGSWGLWCEYLNEKGAAFKKPSLESMSINSAFVEARRDYTVIVSAINNAITGGYEKLNISIALANKARESQNAEKDKIILDKIKGKPTENERRNQFREMLDNAVAVARGTSNYNPF